jgi:hypothetical protein
MLSAEPGNAMQCGERPKTKAAVVVGVGAAGLLLRQPAK